MRLTPSDLLQEIFRNHVAVVSEIDNSRLAGIIGDVLFTLSEREHLAIRLRYGFDKDDGGMIFEEIGRDFGVTRERVRQIILKGVRKLRHPIRSTRLIGLVNFVLMEGQENPVACAWLCDGCFHLRPSTCVLYEHVDSQHHQCSKGRWWHHAAWETSPGRYMGVRDQDRARLQYLNKAKEPRRG